MEKIRKWIQSERMLYRMIAVFSMVSTVLILLLTTIFFTLFSRELKNEIYHAAIQNLRQISNTVSFRADFANSLILQIKEDTQVSKLFYSVDDGDVYAAKIQMDEIRSSVRLLNSVYVYSEETDRVYCSGENLVPYINTTTSFEDKGFLEILENIEDYPKYTPILRKVSLEWPVGREYEVFVYTYLLYDSYVNGPIRNVVAINLHTGWMKEALGYMTKGQEMSDEFWIINSDRKIIYTSDGEMIGAYCDEQMLSDAVFESDSGYFLSGKGQDRQMIVFSTPSRMGYDDWTFVSWNDYATVMRPLEQVRKLIYLVCFVVFFVSLLAVFRVSHVVYEPMRSTIDKVKVLEKENEKKRRIEQMLFLRKLFQGYVADDRNLLKILFNRHQLANYLEEDIRVVQISVDYFDDFVRRYAKHMDEMSDFIEETIRDVFLQYYPSLLCVKMSNGLWAAAVPTGAENGFPEEIFRKLNQILKSKLEISVSMAISQVGHSARDIPYLYSEAVGMRAYRFLRGHNQLITSESLEEQCQDRFEYPSDLEKKLLNHLFNGRYQESIDAYDAFVSEIKRFDVDEVRLSCLFLAYAVKAGAQKSLAEASGTMVEFDDFYSKIQTAEIIDEVNEVYYRLIREITDKLRRNSTERHEALIAQIEAYVEEQYGDINLSMNQISDHVNMSSAYLGRLFKQVTGITFIEYLTKFRLKKACLLLLNTDMTVNDISDQVGFTNSSYFYIIFKKNMECTPNQYRRQHGGSATQDA